MLNIKKNQNALFRARFLGQDQIKTDQELCQPGGAGNSLDLPLLISDLALLDTAVLHVTTFSMVEMANLIDKLKKAQLLKYRNNLDLGT